jgi:hypothetical protein
MGFNRRKMEDERRREAEKQAAAKRARSPQVRADALRLVTEWNERQAQRAPLAELVKLSPQSVADEMREEHRRRVLGD